MTLKTAATALAAIICLLSATAARSACVSGERVCSEDGYALNICEGGEWRTVECMREHGRLCEAGACVDPWRYGSPVWPRAEDEPLATPEPQSLRATSPLSGAVSISTRSYVSPP